MSPCAPEASQALRRSAVRGAASARATPNAQKPSSAALASSASRSFGLPINIFSRYQPVKPWVRTLMDGPAIEAKGLVKSFDGKEAVSGIDLAVPQGSIYGILGPNG